jgi:hypothetical protein
VHAAEQHGVDAEPGGEGEWALYLMAVLAHLGNGGVATDHRHDALVLVDEGLGTLSPQVTNDILCGPFSRLLGDGAELGECSPVVTGRNVGHVSHCIGSGVAGHGEVRSDVDATTAPWGGPGVLGDRRRGLASSPDHSPRWDGSAVGELDPVRVDRSDPRPETDICAHLGQLLERVRVRLAGELPQQGVASVDQGYPARHRHLSRFMKRQHELGQCPGGLNTRWSATYHDDVDRAGLAGLRILYRGTK